MELVVVMVLTAIVISMGLTVLKIVQRHFLQFDKQSSFVTDIYMTDQALRGDFKKATSIVLYPDSSVVKLISNTISPTIYKFNSNNIVRSSSRNDTFKVRIVLKSFSRADTTQKVTGFLVKSLSFDVFVPDGHSFLINFSKSYDSETLFKLRDSSLLTNYGPRN